MDDDMEMIIYGIIVLIHLYYLFIANYVGQGIIDASTDVFYAT